MTRRLRLSNEARRDLVHIWRYTAIRYDVVQAERYERLLKQALKDIEQDPSRPSSKARPDLGERLRSYNVSASAQRSGTAVKDAPHIIVYAVIPDSNLVVVSRVLHGSMDLSQHIPGRHRVDEVRLDGEDE